MDGDRSEPTRAAGVDGLPHDPADFSLVLGGPLYQLLRRAHLTDGALQLQRRRIVVITLMAWLPLLVLSALGGQLLGGGVAVPFLMDADVHVRFLLAMPLALLAAAASWHWLEKPCMAWRTPLVMRLQAGRPSLSPPPTERP